MEIVIRQSGGLGNQLFQYAAGRYFAIKYSAVLSIATEVNARFSHGHPRPVLLDKFKVSARLRPWNRFDDLMHSNGGRRAYVAGRLQAALKILAMREKTGDFVGGHPFFSDLEIPTNVRRVYITGLWQSYPMVRAVEKQLRSELTLLEDLTGRDRAAAAKIESSGHPVSVHIRRGDYATYYGESAILPIQYYERAVEKIVARQNDPTFFVFSDDNEYARAWIRGRPNFFHVDHNGEKLAHRDLRLMALCKEHVIANSTLSWWGAWLNHRNDKKVIAPGKWLGFETAKTDLPSPEWTILEA